MTGLSLPSGLSVTKSSSNLALAPDAGAGIYPGGGGPGGGGGGGGALPGGGGGGGGGAAPVGGGGGGGGIVFEEAIGAAG